MTLILNMVAKDLRRRLRAPVGLVVLLIFPLAFAGMVGLAFSPGNSNGTGLPVIRILMVDHDDGLLSDVLENATGNEEFARRFDMVWMEDEAEARAMMADGEASALLVLPQGFSEDLLDQRPITLELVKNPAQSILPQVVEEMAGVLAVFLDTGVRILGEPIKAAGETFDGVDDDSSLFPDDAALITLTVSLASRVRPISRFVFPPAVVFDTLGEDDVAPEWVLEAAAGDTVADLRQRQLEAGTTRGASAEDGEADSSGLNIFAILLPMVSLMSILFMGDNGMRDLLAEQKAGTLTRQFVSPAGIGRVLLAKVLLTLIICATAMLILGIVGAGLGWIPASLSFAGALLQTGAIALAATGLSTFIYGFAQGERSAATFQSVAVMTMSLVGGSFVPYSQLPEFMQALSPWTINYWGIRGLTELTSRGLGAADILQEAGVLVLIGTVGVAIGWRRLSRRYALGTA